MSQSYEDCIQIFCIRCKDVGLDCDSTVYGLDEETVIDNRVLDLFENHAIEPEEITTCMRLKISENVHVTELTSTELDELMVSLMLIRGIYEDKQLAQLMHLSGRI